MGDQLSTRPSLLARVRDPADAQAWSQLEARYRGLILRYCLARGLQVSDAEDVHQIVLMSLLHSLQGFHYDQSKGRFRDYLRLAVRNAIHRHMARRVREFGFAGPDSPLDVCDPAAEELDELWEHEWMQHHYRLALATLRRTFEPRSMTIFEELLGGDSVEAVAGRHAVSTQSVHKIKQRVRDRLHQLVEAQIRDEEFPGHESR